MWKRKRLSAGKHNLSVGYALADLQEKIERLNTAYDVDKVVEQLEHLDLDGIRMKEDGKHYLIRQGEAIEIVKAGGVNE